MSIMSDLLLAKGYEALNNIFNDTTEGPHIKSLSLCELEDYIWDLQFKLNEEMKQEKQ